MDKCKVYLLLVHFIISLVVSIAVSDFLRKKVGRIDLLKGYCPDHEDAPIKFKNIQVLKIGGKAYISGEFVSERENFTQFNVNIKSTRCLSKEALDTCESMHDLSINGICNIMKVTDQVWTPFIRSIHPPMDCPIKKGTYVVNNGTFDMAPLAIFPNYDKWYWKAQPEIFEQKTKKVVMCLRIEGQIVTV